MDFVAFNVGKFINNMIPSKEPIVDSRNIYVNPINALFNFESFQRV